MNFECLVDYNIELRMMSIFYLFFFIEGHFYWIIRYSIEFYDVDVDLLSRLL